MENSISELIQMQESSVVNEESHSGISSYVSCIRINGRPILPPLITDEKRKELKYYRKKAIEIENKIMHLKQRSATFVKCNTISTSENSLVDVSPSKQSTPARPVTLQIAPNIPGRTFILSSSSDSKINQTLSDQDKAKQRKDVNSNISNGTVSSQKSTNRVRSKSIRSTLEQRLVIEDTTKHNRKNLYEQSPIIEENFSVCESVDSDDVKNERKKWSPLSIDSINSLRVEKSTRDSLAADSSFVSLDDLENSAATLTGSPSLMRQNSYTLLTPSPALLQYLETQKDSDSARRSQSGRKTWDLTKAKKNWKSSDNAENNSVDNRGRNEVSAEKLVKDNSVDGFSAFHTSIRNSSPSEQIIHNSYTDDGSTSPSSYSFKGNSPKFQKIKCKIKNRRTKPHKNVPSPKPMEKVPKYGSNSSQGPETVFVPLQVKEELTDLSKLLLKMKLEHERQKKELEERQKSEMKELELLFKRRESELLERVAQESPVPRSIYSQYSDPIDGTKFHAHMIGDGKHNSTEKLACREGFPPDGKRPQSAKGYYSPSCTDQESRRTRSMDFNQTVPNQDTDLDVSFQDSLQSKELYVGNDVVDTDSVSNCSSHSSTMSSDSKLESMPLLDVKKFKVLDITPEEFQKYNEAAAVITAAARGFLTRRLLRTAHVQGLITTLRDAISCATQLHDASDLGESDVDLMKRLGRQIEAAWEAVYSVFFDTDSATKMQLIATDRERLRSMSNKLASAEPKKRISSATLKSLRRKSGSELFMSKSHIANGSNSARRVRSRMVASYPSPATQYKLK